VLNSKLRQGVTPYLLATAVVLLMTAARWALGVVLGEQLPFITFIIAVLIVAWFGGLGPAAFATLVSAIVAVLLFIPRLVPCIWPS
jgi:K+-sensing histidine kinase KdpD